MLQNPCKTLGFKKNMVYKIPPGGGGGGGKPYPASGLLWDRYSSWSVFFMETRVILLTSTLSVYDSRILDQGLIWLIAIILTNKAYCLQKLSTLLVRRGHYHNWWNVSHTNQNIRGTKFAKTSIFHRYPAHIRSQTRAIGVRILYKVRE